MRERLRTENLRLPAWREFITAHALIVERIAGEMKAAGVISLAWYDVLIELYEAPGRTLRQHELARAVVLSKSNVSRLVGRLAAAGFVRTTRSAADGRGEDVALTEEGVRAMRRAWPVYARGIREHFARHLDDAETAVLVGTFARMLSAGRTPPQEAEAGAGASDEP